MGLLVPIGQDFRWQLSNEQGVRPAAPQGDLLTANATANTMGAWTQIFTAAEVINDVYGILINFNGAGQNNQIRNFLVDVGVDNTGGTNYDIKIPFLMASNAAPYTSTGSGIWYYFPLYIRSGSSIAMRCQGSTGNTTVYTYTTLFGQPRRPDAVRVGSKVVSFGQVTAGSRGTTITIGTTAEGAWTQLGAATTQRYWWWQLGYAAVDNTMANAMIHLDLSAGNATNKKILVEDAPITTNTSEQISNLPVAVGSGGQTAIGDIIYGRAQSSGGADTTPNMMAWGLGG
jgi:hypothetical protein